ncbi:MAG: DUF4838 domain-containing protein [Lentisphaerae bacterium]|nr:DUF4838 domain-containing protein [Lentisphaerota bacterium]
MNPNVPPIVVTMLTMCTVCILPCRMAAAPTELQLSREGMTDYVIVPPASPTKVDTYAVNELGKVLKQVTGAEFSTVAPGDLAADSKVIFVGLSAPALGQLGQNPLGDLEDQEHVARSIGHNIFLYGKGLHGNLYAAMEFLKKSLGRRWFSVFSQPALESRSTIMLTPFNRKHGFSFKYREILPYFNHHFYYQQGVNLAYSWVRTHRSWDKLQAQGIVPVLDGRDRIGGCHTLHSYIPPTPETRQWERYQWITKRDYFSTNPDFFTVNNAGKRVPNRQLCFSNRALRDELTGKILEHTKREGDSTIITVGAQDTGGAFCHCTGCKELEAKHSAPGGAYFDYLLELCNRVKQERPSVRVKGVAYRRAQSQKPPTLADGRRFPDNFVLLFAPIEDPYLGDWTQPDPGLQETHQDLSAWGRIVSHIWVYYYPNPYGTGAVMPLGNVERLITAIRMMHQVGVEGVYLEHASGVLEGGNFTELLTHLFLRLMRDVTCDTDAAIREFTDHQYGPAASRVRTYLAELEQGRKAIKVMPRGVTYSSRTYTKAIWPYLTPENILRWQTCFDAMEQDAAASPTELANVQRLRRNLEFATLFRWFDLAKTYPDYFTDYTRHTRRIRAVNESRRVDLAHQPRPLRTRVVSLFESMIRGGGEKPLPEEFAGTDPLRIRTFIPTMHAKNKYAQGYFDDREAAFGYAPSVHRPDMPFQIGFYQDDTKTHGLRRTIDADEITPGAYRLYKLGTVTLSPKCQIWFSARSWSTKVTLNDLWEPGDANVWEAHASLKFRGPAYGGEPVKGLRGGEENLVLVDRVFLIKQIPEQASRR